MNKQLRTNTKNHEIDETAIWTRARQLLRDFPDENQELMPGLKWGSVYQLYTPAFWKYQYVTNTFPEYVETHRLAGSIRDEVMMCMLGGYGIPSEMGIIAFKLLKSQGLLNPLVSYGDLLQGLSSPMQLPSGKTAKYRFARQKAAYIHAFLNRRDVDLIPTDDDLKLRDWLISVKGIGYKTASWITRNWLRSERVAILDIHLLRAGVITGFFRPKYNVNTEYLNLEEQFITFCNHLGVRPSDMDAIIWQYMKKNNKLALNILASIT
jgi:thermostable 8-oxoguanine DNA glycosylase